MDRVSKFLVCAAGVMLAGCAATTVSGPVIPTDSSQTRLAAEPAVSPAVSNAIPASWVLYVPLSETTAASSLRLFDRYPQWKMVLAVSPRFHKLIQDPLLKTKIETLEQQGRLELALQLPNAPVLPLLVNSDSARLTMSPGVSLPQPAFAFSDDALQIVAQSKADFIKVWNKAPKGLVLPYGASSPELLSLLRRMGFEWIVGALGLSTTANAARAGSITVWDTTTSTMSAHVRVLDERFPSPLKSTEQLAQWAQEQARDRNPWNIPSGVSQVWPELSLSAAGGGKTWLEADWSRWIGNPRSNTAWTWLRKTREMLERYKNSGRASVARLDAAFNELYAAENANFFSRPETEFEFKATLSSIFRLVGENPPEDLFAIDDSAVASQVTVATSAITWSVLSDMQKQLVITDPVGDAQPADLVGIPDIQGLTVTVSSDTLDFMITLSSSITVPLVMDIYMDLNGQPGIGTTSFLPGRSFMTLPRDAWEYALVLADTQAVLYRTRGGGTFDRQAVFPLVTGTLSWFVRIPRDTLRGNPQRWGFQALAMMRDPSLGGDMPLPLQGVNDVLDPSGVSQPDVLKAAAAGQTTALPFLRAAK